MNSKTESDTKTSNMMDSQETLQTEENVTENVAPEVNETENQTIEVPQTQEEVVARVKELAEADAPAEKQELDALKQAFYKIHKANVAAARAQFIENGGESEAFLPAPNVLEDDFKAAMNVIKQKRAELQAELDRQKEENLQKKQEILERIKVLSATPEEANQAYKEFKELQNQWKELTLVPAEKANELWKTYQLYVEQYYDQLKLNNEFREYDFKKNLEIKTRLCETAEKLNEEADVISAFQQLQALHQEFKETGPVAKELREEIWARFKAASTAVNKRHQQYFEELKQKEEENLAHKTALCEKIEAVDLTAIKTATAWEAQTQHRDAKGMAYHWFRPSKDEREDFRAFPWRMRPVLHGKGGILQTPERGTGSKLGQENGTLRKGRGTERQYGLESHGRQTHADTKGMENHRCRS